MSLRQVDRSRFKLKLKRFRVFKKVWLERWFLLIKDRESKTPEWKFYLDNGGRRVTYP